MENAKCLLCLGPWCTSMMAFPSHFLPIPPWPRGKYPWQGFEGGLYREHGRLETWRWLGIEVPFDMGDMSSKAAISRLRMGVRSGFWGVLLLMCWFWIFKAYLDVHPGVFDIYDNVSHVLRVSRPAGLAWDADPTYFNILMESEGPWTTIRPSGAADRIDSLNFPWYTWCCLQVLCFRRRKTYR